MLQPFIHKDFATAKSILKKNNDLKDIITWVSSVAISLAVIYVFLITSFEIVAYGDVDYFQSEYDKYDVAEDLNMEMDDIMYVTVEMMSYLRGDRETLIVDTFVGGEAREFFNESEISHMEDVQELFIAGIQGRKICIGIVIGLFVVLLLLKKGNGKGKHVLPRAFIYTTIAMAMVTGIVGYLFATDFYKYFEIFHHIFFEGDTWIFDPSTSLMINMLPEGLFYDMALRIVATFLGMMGVSLGVAWIINKKNKINTAY